MASAGGLLNCGVAQAVPLELPSAAEPVMAAPAPVPVVAPDPIEVDPVPPIQPKSGGDLVRVGGAVGAWTRGFLQKPQFPGQRSVFPNLEAWIKVEYEW